ncbi:CXXC motif containing zinc binding protein isoform X1 [Melospiza melodia melodia]|uniref:CXXC motif containing zinc binding protein isoform X1 n=1 Tax=Melospiza melodia melodia TaxID=1914991 RepID=UPI002FD0E58E
MLKTVSPAFPLLPSGTTRYPRAGRWRPPSWLRADAASRRPSRAGSLEAPSWLRARPREQGIAGNPCGHGEDRAAAPRHAGEHHPAAGRGRGLPMLKCGNCGEVSEKWQYLRLMDSAPLKGGRGSATMVQKCKLCSRENSIDILSQTIKPYNAEDSEKFKTIVEFECRGLEPVDFQPQAGFAAEGAESGTPFNDINLLEKDWNDYDEKTKESVGIYEVTHKFVKC